MVACVAVGAASVPARGQDQDQRWEAREFTSSVAADDEGREVVTWYDSGEEKEYAFVVGKLAITSTVTVMAVYKYEIVPDAVDPGEPIDFFFYPDPQTASGHSRALGISLDSATGDVYVVGETPVASNGLDIVTLRLDFNLDPTGWAGGGGLEAGVRKFNGSGDANDYATDVVFDPQQDMVYVLGTSDSGANGDDLVTLKYESDGTLSDTWDGESPDNLDGVRRWNNDAVDGDDRSAEIGIAYWAVTESVGPHVVVSGTSDAGGNGDDFVAISFEENGDRTWIGTHSTTGGAFLYDGTEYTDDVCTGIAKDYNNSAVTSLVFLGGYSVKQEVSFWSSTDDVDFTVVAVNAVSGTAAWQAQSGDVGRHWAGAGGFAANDDVCWDIAYWASFQPSFEQLWLGGQTRNGTGYDAVVVTFEPSTGAARWSYPYELVEDGDDRAYAIIPDETTGNLYVTGEEEDEKRRLVFCLSGDDETANLEWEAPYISAEEDDGEGAGLGIALAADGGVVVTGLHWFSSTTQFDFGTAVYDPD